MLMWTEFLLTLFRSKATLKLSNFWLIFKYWGHTSFISSYSMPVYNTENNPIQIEKAKNVMAIGKACFCIIKIWGDKPFTLKCQGCMTGHTNQYYWEIWKKKNTSQSPTVIRAAVPLATPADKLHFYY